MPIWAYQKLFRKGVQEWENSKITGYLMLDVVIIIWFQSLNARLISFSGHSQVWAGKRL